jgi:hypothetical protein
LVGSSGKDQGYYFLYLVLVVVVPFQNLQQLQLVLDDGLLDCSLSLLCCFIGCKSWLSKEHKNAEIFTDGYNKIVFRKDRKKNRGGVFIALHDKFTTSTVENSENDCELLVDGWQVKVSC